MPSDSCKADTSKDSGNIYYIYRLGFDDKGFQVMGKDQDVLRFDRTEKRGCLESQFGTSFFSSYEMEHRHLIIKRMGLFPFPRYVIESDGNQTVVVKCESLFRQRWRIEFSNGETWQFHMPLFSAFFEARSRSEERRVGKECRSR